MQHPLGENRKHVVACTNANGEPDLHFCLAEDAIHAIRQANDQGYEQPYVVFDEEDRCFKNGLENLFVWESLCVGSAHVIALSAVKK